MAPHRALSVPEILELIFEQLHDDENSLALSARTSKLFLEPALNMLWKRVNDGRAVRYLIPKVICDGISKEAPNDDWRRFDFYASRVRTLTGLSHWHHTLSRYRPGHDIFPSLRMLAVSGDCSFSLSMRLPRYLRTLHVHFRSNENTSFNGGLYILCAISQTPFLENLLLRDSVHPMILVHITSFKSLRCLDLQDVVFSPASPTIIQDGFRAIIGMESLLELILPRSLVEDNIPDGVVFRNLRTINISGNPLFFHKIVSILSKTATQTVIIHALNTSPTDISQEWRASLDQLRVQCGTSLRCVIFQIGQAGRTSHGNKWTFEVLKPLLQINDLENFQTSGPLALSVDNITAMATAWSNLQCLKLDVCPSANEVSNTGARVSTIHCLVPLARLCPKLRTLHMKFEDTNLPNPSSFPYLSHHLQELHLEVKSKQNYVELAVLLDRIFPVLSTISVKGRLCNEEIMNLVPQMIRALQFARKERRPVE